MQGSPDEQRGMAREEQHGMAPEEQRGMAQEAAGMPFYEGGVAAGFPSPASGEVPLTLDLRDLCVKHPAATYYIRARGESMIGAGIDDGDVLVVDRSLRAESGNIIIASINGEFTVKRMIREKGKILLQAENPAYPSLTLTPEMGAEFFGVVTWALKRMR